MFRIGTSKDLHQKCTALKVDVIGAEIYTVYMRFRAAFRPEILQTGAVMGLMFSGFDCIVVDFAVELGCEVVVAVT